MTDRKPTEDRPDESIFDSSAPDWNIDQEDAEEFFVTLLDIMQVLLELGADLTTVQQFLDHHADFSGIDSENTLMVEEGANAGGTDD